MSLNVSPDAASGSTFDPDLNKLHQSKDVRVTESSVEKIVQQVATDAFDSLRQPKKDEIICKMCDDTGYSPELKKEILADWFKPGELEKNKTKARSRVIDFLKNPKKVLH